LSLGKEDDSEEGRDVLDLMQEERGRTIFHGWRRKERNGKGWASLPRDAVLIQGEKGDSRQERGLHNVACERAEVDERSRDCGQGKSRRKEEESLTKEGASQKSKEGCRITWEKGGSHELGDTSGKRGRAFQKGRAGRPKMIGGPFQC